MEHRNIIAKVALLALAASAGCSERDAGSAHSVTAVTRTEGVAVLQDGSVSRHATVTSARIDLASPSTPVVADVFLAFRADGASRVRERATGMVVSFRLAGARAVAFVERNGTYSYLRGGPANSDVVHLPNGAGTEDFVVFEARPTTETLAYSVDVRDAAGLRLVDSVLELLDASGTPRLRMKAPYVVDRHGTRHPASVELPDCDADRDPRGPWDRPVTKPSRTTCTVRIAFGGQSLDYPVAVDPAWTATAGAMTAARARHTATLLTNGKVLLAGGVAAGAAGTPLASAELFDPATNTFSATGAMTSARSEHIAVALASGDVLVAMGATNGASVLGTGERYVATTGKFVDAGSSTPRRGAQAALIGDDQVLIAGGIDEDGKSLDDALLWDSTTTTFEDAGRMFSRRLGLFVASVSGRALVVGGSLSATVGDLSSSELFSPPASWARTGSLSAGRRDFAGAVLDTAQVRVLVAGGFDDLAGAAVTTSQVYDLSAGKWSAPTKLAAARAHHTVTALPGGHALVVGGLSDPTDATSALKSVELYDDEKGAFVAAPPLVAARFDHTATALGDGRVLIAGGQGASGALGTAELFTPSAKGAVCTSPAECGTGFCVDGVCCEAACGAACSACSLALTGKANGVCAPSLAGQDPHDDCIDDGSPACTKDGLCDGKGACAAYAKKPCTPSACTVDDDCKSGHCTDGICCDSACDGECEACTAAKTGKTDGTCLPVAKGKDPDAECGILGSGVCKGTATCDGASACRATTFGKDCKAAECQDDVTLAAPATCTATGECGAETTSCDPYTCDAKAIACRTRCAKDTDCAEGAVCTDGECQRLPDGDACAAANECTSGFCADGVCCDKGCDGQCETCAVSGSEGTCKAIEGTPQGDRPACDGEAPCQGTCNGLIRERCLYPTSDTSCGDPGSCSDGTETRSACNLGECVQGVTKDCLPYVCGDEACKTSCNDDTDCAPKLTCNDSGRCVVSETSTCPDGGTGSDCEGAGKKSDDSGCGCRVGVARTAPRSCGALAGLLLSLALRRAYGRRTSRKNQRAASRHPVAEDE